MVVLADELNALTVKKADEYRVNNDGSKVRSGLEAPTINCSQDEVDNERYEL